MQYISPLFLLETLDAQQPAKSILLARKKTLAELELNDGRPITINGRELTRHDIIKLFDELQRPGNLAWHVAIAEDKVLTGFLENAVLEKGARFG